MSTSTARWILFFAAQAAAVTLAVPGIQAEGACDDFTGGVDPFAGETHFTWSVSPAAPGEFTPTEQGLRFETNGQRSASIVTNEVFTRGVRIHARARLDHPHFNIYFGDLVNFTGIYGGGSGRTEGTGLMFYLRGDPVGEPVQVQTLWRLDGQRFVYGEELEIELRVPQSGDLELRIWRVGEDPPTAPIYHRRDDNEAVGSVGIQIETGTLISVCVEELQRPFLRGDCNDDGTVDISDAVCALNWLFLGSEAPGCIAALNTNGDEDVDIADPVYSLWFSFLGGPAPVAPFPECGIGTLPTDEETCETPPIRCQ